MDSGREQVRELLDPYWGAKGVWETAAEKRFGKEGPEPGEVLRREGLGKR